jgi:EAL domain-containing protein (putative c-di-GMP-specific phosphodiesterase class I)
MGGRQLDEDSLIDDVRGALQESGFDPAALTLEITETALMSDPDAAARRLIALKQLGVRIAIDDFGTGYVQAAEEFLAGAAAPLAELTAGSALAR